MRDLVITGVLISLIGCSGGGGSDPAPVPTQPSNSTSSCDGDVVFNAAVPTDVPSDTSSNDTASTDNSVPGIGNPAVSKVLAAADAHGLRVVGMEEKDGITIVSTCGSPTINVGNTSNSNNTSGAQPNGN